MRVKILNGSLLCYFLKADPCSIVIYEQSYRHKAMLYMIITLRVYCRTVKTLAKICEVRKEVNR